MIPVQKGMISMNYPVKSIYTRVGMWINSVLYAPEDEANNKNVAVVVMHSDADYLNFPAGKALASLGYRTLCANVSRVSESLDKKLLDVKACIEYLKQLPGVEKVVILGHSGGATLMSCYQAVAENGVTCFQDDKKIVPISDIGDLPQADAVILLDSNWGNGVMTLISLDPAVKCDCNGVNLDPAYNLANPDVGYTPDGAHYTDEFITAYQKAQSARNNRLIDAALERLDCLKSGKGSYRDDEPWIIAGASQIAPNNRMFPQDTRLLSHTKNEWPLVHADGSITVGIIPSLRKPREAKPFTSMYGMGSMQTSVKSYLASQAVRSTEDFGYDETHIYGVDWDSSYCCTPGNVRQIHAPMLIMGLTGGYEFLAAECIYEMSASEDKTLAFIEGASHMVWPAKESEAYPGQFGDTVQTTFKYAAEWLSKHF